MNDEVIFKLGEMIRAEVPARYAEVKALARAIYDINKAAQDPSYDTDKEAGSTAKKSDLSWEKDTAVDKINYRKLAYFINDKYGDDFNFTISELRALERYFDHHGQSLCKVPIFYRRESVLDYLAENRRITFMVATRYQKLARTDTVSRWDLRAMNLLFNHGAFDDGDLDVEDVFHQGSNVREIARDRWNHHFGEQQVSILSFASPFACHATARMLAEIFDAEPYRSAPVDPQRRLPLYFYWPRIQERQTVREDPLLLKQRQLPRLFGADSPLVAELADKQRAFIVGDRCFASEGIGISYGLLVVQRQDSRRVFAAVIGAYGPDTYAVAQCLAEDQVVGELPGFDGRLPGQPVFIAVIETRISGPGASSAKGGRHQQRELRELVSVPRVCHSELWEMDSERVWRSSDEVPARTKTGAKSAS